MPAVWQGLTKEIEANRIFHVGRVEINHVLDAMTWYVVEQFRCKIAVRVNDTNAVSGTDVLQDEISQKRRLAGAAFPDGVKMVASVAGR